MTTTARCVGTPATCYGYHGRYDLHTCLADNHDITEPVEGRVPCRANDKRWAEVGTLTCRFHRDPAADHDQSAVARMTTAHTEAIRAKKESA